MGRVQAVHLDETLPSGPRIDRPFRWLPSTTATPQASRLACGAGGHLWLHIGAQLDGEQAVQRALVQHLLQASRWDVVVLACQMVERLLKCVVRVDC